VRSIQDMTRSDLVHSDTLTLGAAAPNYVEQEFLPSQMTA